MNYSRDYFANEIREDFEIPEMMKCAWAAAFEVYEVVADICRRHSLRLFADWGTLLGAVRHQGFIPWDDDIDVALLREDYDKLIELLPMELPPGFALAGMYAAEERLQRASEASQLRVIADENYWNFPNYLNRFHAFPYPRIGIDIFPLENIPKNPVEAKRLDHQVFKMLELLSFWNQYTQEEFEDRVATVEKLVGRSFLTSHGNIDRNCFEFRRMVWLEIDRVSASCTKEASTEVGTCVLRVSDKDYRIPRSAFDETVELPFETMSVLAPRDYRTVLSAEFGDDYMTPIRFAADHDYPFYATQQNEMERIFAESGIDKSVEEFCHNWHQLMFQMGKN